MAAAIKLLPRGVYSATFQAPRIGQKDLFSLAVSPPCYLLDSRYIKLVRKYNLEILKD
ncbi:hypothetical protein FCM35_KLT14634 [Carex littledalei]|uniref:Uncharacterized protein n=1 Tax=Carex littledalei TaxID=544730 RepID=A0A833QK44_9POAL|nr:hypothetical protein FCM35_KLT14634 [Carex littledalei]